MQHKNRSKPKKPGGFGLPQPPYEEELKSETPRVSNEELLLRLLSLGSELEGETISLEKDIHQLTYPGGYFAERIVPTALDAAKKALAREDIRKYLCIALGSVSNDALEIAKVATPFLATLSVAKQINLPLDTMLYAMIAVTISRMGVTTLCKDVLEVKEKK
jgi:hypothetical protein